MKLDNKNVVLTGASSGIGLELLYNLSSKGCKIVAVSRNIEKIPKLPNVYPHRCDVSKKDELDKLFDYAKGLFDNIDVFISNAGFAYYEKIEKPDYEHIDEIFKTNVFAPIYCLEKMVDIHKNNSFTYVITASAVAKMPLPGYAIYSSTKAAIDSFQEAYRYEMDKINLLVVYPIATRTNFFKTSNDKIAPVPYPSQSPEYVAKCIIKGIEKNKKYVFPSKTFVVINTLNRIFPFINKLYQSVQNKKFKKWLKDI
ncbi:short-chain dehydrogenase [Fervidicella metallireducens AeB]|uniref:Short-chain dehydrogenase n=1 Tax=Fervidicella metallireducens AeB TaxID=1403537 RepID=A0A017RS55_9CLOT|nr:SDR family NAD(P)-dependent oxidoreductase [Fervidicella metallireducens]EYE87431.1 short-chain dehydrogenase [Fervidicella metallireducens AeB]